jgi:hypothetical protein
MSILDDLKSQLATDGVVDGATGWGCYLGGQPETPDKTITIYETGGDGEPDQFSGTEHTYPTFQVRGRGAAFGYEALRTKMQDVFNSLNNVDISGYVYVYPVDSGPIALGYDGNNRPQLVWNFKVMK